MADISDFDNVSGSDLTESQIKGILKRIDLNIYNILENKWDAVPYAEFGDAGHRRDGAALLAELRRQREFYQKMLDDVPAEELSQWDNPVL